MEPCFSLQLQPKPAPLRKKTRQFWLLQHFPLLPLRRRSSPAEPGSEPAPALGLPVHGCLALLQRLLQLCQLAAAHFQPLPGRQERNVSRTQQNRNLYKYSLHFQGRFHQTQTAAVTCTTAAKPEDFTSSFQQPTHSCHSRAPVPFWGR